MDLLVILIAVGMAFTMGFLFTLISGVAFAYIVFKTKRETGAALFGPVSQPMGSVIEDHSYDDKEPEPELTYEQLYPNLNRRAEKMTYQATKDINDMVVNTIRDTET